ncbi:MAG TPA: DUF2111 domain-containing protein [Methanospirillum sp.]|uniref:DUF2111 domain-containing protein n=1 Tax=Methanospirillum sp. TaxID=45200 RepID=UPI001BD6A7CF|nr:DUF2111 domain-containing protein [Methanospirillum sp.]HPY59454.1 DUF2111 domain-containing protein [Methanospirillum sp.]
MNRYVLSSSSEPSDWIPISMAIHEMVGKLPVTARSLEKNGIRIENGTVADDNYSGPVLEEVLKAGEIRKVTPSSGQYKGIPVIVAPLKDDDGKTFAAIGVVDITGIFDLATLMEHQSTIIKQVCGKDPCPLPTEQISAKR